VGGQVQRAQRQGLVQVALQIVQRLRRQAVHQVDAVVGKAGGARQAQGFAALVGAVHAAQHLQQVRAKGLHAKTDAVHAAAQQQFQLGGVGAAGVGRDGEFVHVGRVNMGFQHVEEAVQFVEV